MDIRQAEPKERLNETRNKENKVITLLREDANCNFPLY